MTFKKYYLILGIAGLVLTITMLTETTVPKSVGAATTVPLGKNGTSQYLLYPTDSLTADRYIATSTTASSTFQNVEMGQAKLGTLNGLLTAATGFVSTVATSSLGLPTFATLNDYLTLSTWYATTTDGLNEGTTNKYDKTVAFTNGTNVSMTGTYPNFTIADSLTPAFTAVTATRSTTTNATTTSLAVANLSAGLVKALTGGSLVNAVAGVDYENIITAGDGLTRTVNDFDCDTASGSVFGCLSSTDWTTFNGKESPLTFSYPLSRSVNAISLAFGTTTSNTWAGTQTFGNTIATNSTTTNATSTNLYVSTGLTGTRNSLTGLISPIKRLSYISATSTAWTATTSGAYLPPIISPFAGTIHTAQCSTDAGTLNVDIYHTTTHLTLFNASTTVGTVSFSSNNTVTNGEKIYIAAGTPSSSPTVLSCTLSLTETP